MTLDRQPTKLIEVALPLSSVNDAAIREMRNPFAKGHPKSLKWWARRPLASCRAILFAQLIDDPSAHPDRFPTIDDQAAERKRLFSVLEEALEWPASSNEEILGRLRAEITESIGGGATVLDPFSGGASFPLEAARLGLSVDARDLNPVAVQIARTLLEVPHRWQDRPPISPSADRRTRWNAAQGIAEDLRKYAAVVAAEARNRVGSLYDSPGRTGEEQPLTWLWARLGRCASPTCSRPLPLVSSFWLSKKKGRRSWVIPREDSGRLRYDIEQGGGEPPAGTKQGRGASFRCPHCSSVLSRDELRAQYEADRDATAVLMATVSKTNSRRVFEGTDGSATCSFGTQFAAPSIPDDTRAWWFKPYGVTTYADMFTERQATILDSLSLLIRDWIQELVARDAGLAGMSPRESVMYSKDIALLLAQGLMRCVMFGTSLCSWNVTNENVTNPFGMTAPSFAWDFAEANLLRGALGFESSASKVAEVIDNLPSLPGKISVEQSDATKSPSERPQRPTIIATDPPYYDNVTYSDMADVFYMWMRRALHVEDYPELSTIRSPTEPEIVANASRHSGNTDQANERFERLFREAFANMRKQATAPAPMTVVYAFKQSELSEQDGVVSTGWSTMLDGMRDAGWAITATWPMVMEREARRRGQASNALASSVVLACRPRPENAPVTDRRGFIQELTTGMKQPLRDLQHANIAPVDLRQAAIGPGMAVFSRFSSVVESDGSSMRAQAALGLINEVLDQMLDEQSSEFDAETRWAIHWFSQNFFDEGPYGLAESLAISVDVAVSTLVRSGIVQAERGKTWLVGWEDLSDNWTPGANDRIPVWEATQHLVKRLDADGEASAADLLRRVGAAGHSVQALAYRLYAVCESARPKLAGQFNALVVSWPEIQRLARESSAPVTDFEQQSLGT